MLLDHLRQIRLRLPPLQTLPHSEGPDVLLAQRETDLLAPEDARARFARLAVLVEVDEGLDLVGRDLSGGVLEGEE